MDKNVINLKFYKGADLYCDGAIEDEILEIVSSPEPVLEVLKKGRIGRFCITYLICVKICWSGMISRIMR